MQFITESIKISLAQRMDIGIPVDEGKLKIVSGIKHGQDIDSILGEISLISKEMLMAIGREIGRIGEREKLKEIEIKERTKTDKEGSIENLFHHITNSLLILLANTHSLFHQKLFYKGLFGNIANDVIF